jgi:hypothetical protein
MNHINLSDEDNDSEQSRFEEYLLGLELGGMHIGAEELARHRADFEEIDATDDLPAVDSIGQDANGNLYVSVTSPDGKVTVATIAAVHVMHLVGCISPDLDLTARLDRLEDAVRKHRRALEPERCTTCTTDSWALWSLVGDQP